MGQIESNEEKNEISNLKNECEKSPKSIMEIGEFSLIKCIGKGSFGKVMLAKRIKNGIISKLTNL